MLRRVRVYLLFVSVLLAFYACVPNRKIVYLQDRQSDQIAPSVTPIKSLNLQPYEHKLKPGDIVSIQVSSLTQEKFNVFNKPVAAGMGNSFMMQNIAGLPPTFPGYTVGTDGTVELTAIGPVKIAGLSVKEAQEKIKKILVDYLKDPVVEIKLINFSYTLIGEVTRQGTYITGHPHINLMEALAAAGGMTEIANHSKVKIIRHENGIAKVFYVNVLEDNLLQSENYYLHPNDVVVIAPLKARNLRQYFSSTTSVFSIITGAAAVVTTILLLK